MNIERIEHELTLANGKPVIVIQPMFGSVTITLFGTITVTTCNESKTVGFHVIHSLGVLAIIFLAEDVVSLQDAEANTNAVKVIRLKSSHQYGEKFQRFHA